MLNVYHIIDDFYSDPDAVVKHALEMTSEDKSRGNYAGIMTDEPILTTDHKRFFENFLRQEIKPATGLCGKIRFTTETDTSKQTIHFDYGEDIAWAGVIYLQKEHPKDIPGTEFWKHKRTGLEEIPRTLEGIQKYGWNGVDDLKDFLDTEGNDYSLWERTMVIPYKYNRLILFRPWLFHSPGVGFGKSKETARMVQTLFFS